MQVSFESPQFTNLDNSIDIADNIGELYVVDSYYVCRFDSCCGRSELKYDPLVHKLIPVRFRGRSQLSTFMKSYTAYGF